MSLTLDEARARAAALSDVSYDLRLDVTEPGRGWFGVEVAVGFTSTGADTFLELTRGEDVALAVDGEPRDPAYDGRRIPLTGLTPGAHVVTVTARVPYVTDGDGMHLFVDPADGETYVSAYLGMDVTQRVFPCFDQVDLKAPVTLAVVADPAWTVLANGRATSREEGSWTFATTPPIPIDNFVVCCGPWHSVTWEHAGLPFGWHARRSLAAELERDAEELRRTTVDCFDHYAGLLDEPYPFDSYDQAMVPGQNWGAQEMPGCVVYRDELLPRGRITETQRSHRAMIIAHEMAHMWFGNLVTMRWWEDTWLNESFADYMGYRVAADGAGFAGTLLLHEGQRKPGAYDADVRRSTHPVAPAPEDVPDVDAAFGNFDAISYAKGNSVLRQLATWLGDDDFLAGVNAHLTRHRFGNASLADFVEALDGASDRDVRGWVEVWLARAGHDTIRVELDGDVPVLHRDGVRPHRFRVTAYDDALGEVGSRLVDLGDDPVRLEEYAGRVVVPNAHGETFAALRLDPRSSDAVTAGLSSVDDDLVRAVLWQTLFEQVQSRVLAPSALLDAAASHLPRERSGDLVHAVLGRVAGAVLPRQLPAADAAAARDLLATACREGLGLATDAEARLAFAAGLADHSRDADLLHEWLRAGRHLGVELDPRLRWSAVHRLAELGAIDDAEVERQRRDDGTIDGELGAARARAARPTAEAKAEAWSAAADDERVSNRMFAALLAGLWSPEQADLCAPYVSQYLAEGATIAERRGQAFSQVVGRAFPALALSPAQLDELRVALSGPVPTVLRRHWEDHLDDRS
ncbi:aminopeptidase N [Nocardioides sp. SYSU D00038]|uniref:aminopeptidase N n=1 Tax=Nocardioides sp. SYSU D00038 TaxID=2812554 RepID=UPI0019686648|nr:aminopeptidase N [Nocardioides sp. SYSU D00038]